MKRIIALSIVALALAGCSAKSATTATTSTTSPSTTTTAATPGVGATQSFHSEDVTLGKVIDPAAMGPLGSIPAGDRFVAVELGIKNTGTVALSPTPIFDAILIDQSGHSYTSVVNGTPSCQDFAGSLSVDPSASASGCVLFEVPTAEAPAKFQYITKEAGADVERTEWVL